jgi:HWE histidine kinase
MREINHRAKNMLGLVQAIARQTATREPEDFIVCFTERILRPIRTCWSATSGRELMSKTWRAPNSPTLPILWAPGSRCMARNCV